ncbi:copia protein [Tanacetum coccineum]
MKVEESLNVTFDESPPPTKLSPLVDDDVGEEEAIIKNTKVVNNNNEEDESIEADEIVNVKESKNHPLDQVIGNLNQRTLSSQSLADDVVFGSTCQNLCDDFAKIMHDEFEMSMMGELNFFLGLQIKQLENGIFFNQSKYIKEMLKKFGLEDSKPTKMRCQRRSISLCTMKPTSWIALNIESTHLEAVKRIFRYIGGTSHLGLRYPKGTGIETIVYADSDHVGDYVDRKSTSVICTFMGCCLTSWFSKKQTALAISTTEAEYIFAEKACQQALWMKQALIDYGIRLDDVSIMCDNKGAIDLSKNPLQHSRTKHVEISHYFLCDNIQKGNISTEKVASEDNIADIFTKPLKRTKMPSEYQQDYKKTRAYAPKIYNDPKMFDTHRDIYRTLKSRYVHEGRTIVPSFYNDLTDDLVAKFTAIERDFNNHFSIQFIINNYHFNLALAQFAKLTHLPNQGICIYSDAWGLDELEKTLEQIEPYNSHLPALDDI